MLFEDVQPMKEACNLPPQEGNLLIVDDNPNNLRLLMEILTAQGYRVRLAKEGTRALTLAQMERPELILLDIMMPGLDGFEVCRRLKADENTRDVPVIFISALDATFDKVKAFEAGGVDFVTKPLKSEEVLARVRTHLSLHRMQVRLESQNAQLETYRNHLEELVAERTAEVNESRERLSAVLKSVPDCLLVLDLEGRVVLVNRSAERLFGMSSSALKGERVSTLAGGKVLQEQFFRVVNKEWGAAPAQAFIDPNLGGKRAFRLSGSQVEAGDGEVKGVILVLRDVSQELESERLKSEFLSTAAHELNTPLTSVIGYAELLLTLGENQEVTPEQQQEFLGVIVEKGGELAQIVSELLDISRIETGFSLPLQKEPCDLAALIGDVADAFVRDGQGRRVELALEQGGSRHNVDKKKMVQAVECLLANAVKFSSPDSLIRVASLTGPDGYQITVEDQGIGMTVEQMRRAFDKFYRADASDTSVGGFGLGLTIAKNIVEAHGGRIVLDSEIGKGTRVTIILPLPEADE